MYVNNLSSGPRLDLPRLNLDRRTLPMRTRAKYDAVRTLISSGSTDGAVASALGIPRETVRDWRRAASAGRAYGTKLDPACPVCSLGAPFDKPAYAYLLGLYLGDGWLSEHPRSVFKLRVSLDARQPAIVDESRRPSQTSRLASASAASRDVGALSWEPTGSTGTACSRSTDPAGSIPAVSSSQGGSARSQRRSPIGCCAD